VNDTLAVIIHYRSPREVGELISTLPKHGIALTDIVVVDNSGEFVNGEKELFGATCLTLGRNAGYAGAANLGFEVAVKRGYANVLVLTQDVTFDEGCIKLLQARMAPQVGVVAPVLGYRSDNARLFSSGGRITRHGRTLHPGQGGAITHMGGEAQDVDWADGACLLISVGAWRAIGGFDEDYFLYVEEVDFCWRARRAGYGVVIEPKALAYQEPGNYDPYYRFRNLPRFTRKNVGLRPWPILPALVRDVTRFGFKRDGKRAFWAIRGVLGYYLGEVGPRPKTLLSSPQYEPIAPVGGERKVLLLAEGSRDSLAPGLARRMETLEAHWRSRGAIVETRVLGGAYEGGKLARISALMRQKASIPPGSTVHLVALAAPHVMGYAGVIALRNPDVRVFADVCDSTLGQLRHRFRVREYRLVPSALTYLAFLFLFSRHLTSSYITERDAVQDRILLRGERPLVIRLDPPRSRSSRVEYDADELLCVGDFRSFHVRRGVRALASACQEWPNPHPPKVVLAGPGAEREAERTPGWSSLGWVDDPADIYGGRSVVFCPNENTTGVPNKLVEALTSRSRIVCHVSFEPLLGAEPGIYYWRNSNDLGRAVRDALVAKVVPDSDSLILRLTSQ